MDCSQAFVLLQKYTLEASEDPGLSVPCSFLIFQALSSVSYCSELGNPPRYSAYHFFIFDAIWQEFIKHLTHAYFVFLLSFVFFFPPNSYHYLAQRSAYSEKLRAAAWIKISVSSKIKIKILVRLEGHEEQRRLQGFKWATCKFWNI